MRTAVAFVSSAVAMLSVDAPAAEVEEVIVTGVRAVVSAPNESRAINKNLQLEYNNGGPLTANLRWVHLAAKRTYDESRMDAGVTSGEPIPRGAAGNFTRSIPPAFHRSMPAS